MKNRITNLPAVHTLRISDILVKYSDGSVGGLMEFLESMNPYKQLPGNTDLEFRLTNHKNVSLLEVNELIYLNNPKYQ